MLKQPCSICRRAFWTRHGAHAGKPIICAPCRKKPTRPRARQPLVPTRGRGRNIAEEAASE